MGWFDRKYKEKKLKTLVPDLSPKSIQIVKNAAENGYADSQMRLGSLYLTGKGVIQSNEYAKHWLKRAAENGNDEAKIYLGFMYQYGIGVYKSEEKAKKLYNEASNKGVK